MTKHEQYYIQMIDQNKELFNRFFETHDKYQTDSAAWQQLFNEEGKKVLEVIRQWEKKLCQQSEKGQYGKYSANLADKFWGLVRKDFPKIDFVGVSIT